MYLDFADKFNVLIGSEGAVGKSSTSSVVESSKAEVVINVGALKAGCQLGKLMEKLVEGEWRMEYIRKRRVNKRMRPYHLLHFAVKRIQFASVTK